MTQAHYYKGSPIKKNNITDNNIDNLIRESYNSVSNARGPQDYYIRVVSFDLLDLNKPLNIENAVTDNFDVYGYSKITYPIRLDTVLRSKKDVIDFIYNSIKNQIQRRAFNDQQSKILIDFIIYKYALSTTQEEVKAIFGNLEAHIEPANEELELPSNRRIFKATFGTTEEPAQKTAFILNSMLYDYSDSAHRAVFEASSSSILGVACEQVSLRDFRVTYTDNGLTLMYTLGANGDGFNVVALGLDKQDILEKELKRYIDYNEIETEIGYTMIESKTTQTVQKSIADALVSAM